MEIRKVAKESCVYEEAVRRKYFCTPPFVGVVAHPLEKKRAVGTEPSGPSRGEYAPLPGHFLVYNSPQV
jgi:hypothetical protein